jgi:succinoglycan biosynthesis protein ExoL
LLPRILYLVPNLSDSAVARRIDMLRLGGASVDVAGFRRAGTTAPQLDVGTAIELGETFDARFIQRIVAAIRAGASTRQWAGRLQQPDVIIARNLEMLSLASRLQGAWPNKPAIVYECLDIHRLMLRGDGVGRAMRSAERHLGRKASLLLTSSPAFLHNYFSVHGSPPAVIVENKVIWDGGSRGSNPALRSTSENDPLRIGWFGALRCNQSLRALTQFADGMKGAAKVVLRGRPALTEFNDFHAAVANQAHLRFEGPYRNPQDLSKIYSEVHLAWAIDFFEAGGNSQWLLPNRIYEGTLNGAVPVVLAGTETAAFAKRHGIGIVLPDITPETLQARLGQLRPQQLVELAQAVAALNPKHFAVLADECRLLVEKLGALVTRNTIAEVAA